MRKRELFVSVGSELVGAKKQQRVCNAEGWWSSDGAFILLAMMEMIQDGKEGGQRGGEGRGGRRRQAMRAIAHGAAHPSCHAIQ